MKADAAFLTAAALGLALAAPVQVQRPTDAEPPMSGSILVHLTHGPEHPTRAALAFNVAHAALEQGHRVPVFLAGDADVPFYLSGDSSAA